MKKTFATILIVLLTVSVKSYIDCLESQHHKVSTETRDGFFKNDLLNLNERETSEPVGGFFSDSDGGGPGDRPGPGDGIGQEAPVGGGLPIIITCCAVWAIVKTIRNKRNN